jgi:ADP-ribose pyrophosphatase YjhB (NUDIX family)
MQTPPSSPPDFALRAGASIALFKDRKVLLVRRKHAPFAGLWSLPGGKAEGQETPRETACRELKEETGLEAEIAGVVDRVTVAAEDAEAGSEGYRLTVFYGLPRGGSLKAGGDIEAAEWVHLDDIEALPMTPGTIELIWVAAHRVRMC